MHVRNTEPVFSSPSPIFGFWAGFAPFVLLSLSNQPRASWPQPSLTQALLFFCAVCACVCAFVCLLGRRVVVGDRSPGCGPPLVCGASVRRRRRKSSRLRHHRRHGPRREREAMYYIGTAGAYIRTYRGKRAGCRRHRVLYHRRLCSPLHTTKHRPGENHLGFVIITLYHRVWYSEGRATYRV